MRVDELIKELTTEGSWYYTSLMRFSSGNKRKYRELLSEISMAFLVRKDKIESIPNLNMKGYFYNTIKYMNMNTSDYYRNNVKRINSFDNEDFLLYMQADNDSEEVIEGKIEMENQLDLIDHLLYTLQISNDISWFQTQLFYEYYLNDQSYRQVGAKYSLSVRTIWDAVTHVKNKLKENVNR